MDITERQDEINPKLRKTLMAQDDTLNSLVARVQNEFGILSRDERDTIIDMLMQASADGFNRGYLHANSRVSYVQMLS